LRKGDGMGKYKTLSLAVLAIFVSGIVIGSSSVTASWPDDIRKKRNYVVGRGNKVKTPNKVTRKEPRPNQVSNPNQVINPNNASNHPNGT
jgi:hypothetical protein